MPTSPVVSVVSGSSFSVNVTTANLDSVLTLRDFVVLENGTLTLNPNSYNKTTATTLTYGGPVLPSTTLEIRRSTPRSQRTVVLPNTKVRASDWNAEFDRRVRIQEEIDLYGAGGGFSVRLPNDTAYGVSWASDSLFPPTRRVVYDKVETLAPLANPTFTGLPVAPTATLGTNTTQIATTAFVTSANSLLAPIASPPFTGNPTANTQLFSDNSTRLANTAHVKLVLNNSPTVASPTLTGTSTVSNATFSGTVTIPSLSLGSTSTTAANALQVARSCRPIVIVSRTTAFTFTTTYTDLVFNNAIRNTEASYNTTTGVFTAPYTGIYAFSCFISNFASVSLFTVVSLGSVANVELHRLGLVAGSGIFHVVSGRQLVFMNSGDIRRYGVQVGGSNSGGSPESTGSSQLTCYASIEYLGIDT